MDRQRTIARLWRDAVARWPTGDTAYLAREGADWRNVTWGEAAATVEARANGFLARGLRKGDAYAILAGTTLDWALTDFALAHVGAVTAPIYATSSQHDVAYVLEHSGAVGVLCEDDDQRAKVEAARAGLAATPRGADVRRPGRARRGRCRSCGAASARARRCRGGDRRGRPLHVHLHVGHDRPAEGLHDPPPELLRDGRGGGEDAALRRAG